MKHTLRDDARSSGQKSSRSFFKRSSKTAAAEEPVDIEKETAVEPDRSLNPNRTVATDNASFGINEKISKDPHALPKIPFSWPTGRKLVLLWSFIIFAFIELCLIPEVLYFALKYDTNVTNWIIFAIITALWGFNVYWQLSWRTWFLFRKPELRPLGMDSKWGFDLTAWVGSLGTGAAVILLVIGTIPKNVWIRVCSMAGPSILLADGFLGLLITIYSLMGWRAPFRLSSTAKGEFVKPCVFYFVEDALAVDGKGSRVLRQAMADRYAASPRFRRMMFVQSIFWTVPMLVLAAGLTAIVVIHPVPKPVAFGVGSGVPWVWVPIWAFFSWRMVKRDLRLEREEWAAKASVQSISAA